MSPVTAGIIGFALGLLVGVGITVGIVRRIAVMGRETRLAQEAQQAQLDQQAREAAWNGWQDKREPSSDWN